ncbi:MAG TPA: hypothetical protein VHU91_04315 [Mycobacteriales bacterium]|jgi:hypothetical protein|nr:hypothetical protein [Mycobacteriales bacterium]
MLKKSSVALLVVLLVIVGSRSASAADSTREPQPHWRCVVTDKRIDNASGLVTFGTGYAVINDRGSHESAIRAYLLDANCQVTKVLESPGSPSDIEDLGRTSDGALWLADIGDNDSNRADVTIWKMPPDGGTAKPYRLSYPDGPHDAEALILTDNKTPIIVTKTNTGKAGIYLAAASLTGRPREAIPLRHVGTLTVKPTGTQGGAPGGNVAIANVLVTGGAVSADGRRVALRTYTDVYEWRIRRGDSARHIAATIKNTSPQRTAVPGEHQGESLAYADHDSRMSTLSEGLDKPLQEWTLFRPPQSAPDHTARWIAASVVVALGLAALAILLIRRFRRNHA